MRDVMPAPSLEVTGPGVYPLETRECREGCRFEAAGGKYTKSGYCRDLEYCPKHSDPYNTRRKRYPNLFTHPTDCIGCCHGTGRVPDENGPKVRIDNPDGRGFRFRKAHLSLGGWSQQIFPTPAEAFAAAQRAHKEGKQ